MYLNYDKVYIRTSFTYSGDADKLFLYMYFDDAFVAYVNGVKVASDNISDSGKISTTSDPLDKRFSIKLPASQDNTYTLAIVGYNQRLKSSDFSLQPWLSEHYISSQQRAWMKHPAQLSNQQAREDLQFLSRTLQDRASYLHRYAQDIVAQLNTLENSLPDNIPTLAFADKVNQIVLTMGDCHYKMLPSPVLNQSNDHLPFKLARTNMGWVAIDNDSGKLLNNDFPIVTAIDGIKLSAHKAIATRYARNCSAQMVDKNLLSLMQYNFPVIRAALDLPKHANKMSVTLGDDVDDAIE